MIKIILLAQDRRFAVEALNSIAKQQNSGNIVVEAIVSERSFYDKARNILNSDIAWINNEARNESDIIDVVRARKIDAAISLQHRWIMSETLIDALNGYAFNTHFGKLPEYRGHGTYFHAIMNDEDYVTTTLHWIDPRVDLGDIILEVETPIEADDTSWSLWHKSIDEAMKLQEQLLDYLIAGTAPPRRAVVGDGTFYKMNSIDGLKNINDPGDFEEVDKKSRGFYFPPHEPAYFMLNNKKYYVIPKGVYHETVV